MYTWRVNLHATSANRSATHRCGQAVETTMVAKAGYHSPVVNGGFSGTVSSFASPFGGFSGIVSSFASPFARAPRAPARIRIQLPAIGMHASVRRERIIAGEMTRPGDVSEVGWLRRSAGFGDKIGKTVVGGHVSDRHDSPGAMFHLNRAQLGQRITVTRAGKLFRFEVAHKATLDRRRNLPHRFFATTGPHRLVLISCTDKVVFPNGHFHYTRYMLVVAKPVHRRR